MTSSTTSRRPHCLPRASRARLGVIRPLSLLLVAIVVGMGIVGTARAQAPATGDWEDLGATAGSAITAIASDGTGTIVLGTDTKGILVTSDFGTTWKAGNAGLGNMVICGLLFAANKEVFAANEGGTVYASMQPANGWAPANNGLGNAKLQTIVKAPVGGAIYAGTSQGVFGFNTVTRAWTKLGTTGVIWTMTIGYNGAILAATPDAGAFRSTDGGATWKTINIGTIGVISMAASPDGYVYAASSGLYRSANGGVDWASTSLEAPFVYCVVVDNDGRVYASTPDGVYRSDDHGGTWNDISTNLQATSIRTLALDPSGALLAGSSTGHLYANASPATSAVAGPGIAGEARGMHLGVVPNLASTAATLRFSVPAGAPATIDLFAVTGRHVARLYSEAAAAEHGTISIDVRNLPNGQYYCRLSAGARVIHAPLVVVR